MKLYFVIHYIAYLKLLPGERLPHPAGDGAEQAHAHQEEHNL